MHTKYFLLIVLTLLFCGLVYVDAEPKKVIAEGIGDNNAKGRQDAYNDALRKAIEKAVGTYVSVELQVENKELIDQKIYSRNEAYIKSVEVIDKGVNREDLYFVRIQALVEEGKIKNDLQAFEILSRRKGNPRLMVIVKAQERNKQWVYANPHANAIRAKIENRLLRSKFRMVDLDQVKNIDKIEKALAAGDAAQLKALAGKYGCEVVATCSLSKTFTDKTNLFGRSVDMYAVELSLKAVVADTAQMIYSDAESMARVGEANIPPIFNKATGLTKSMIKDIQEKWQADVFNEAVFELTVLEAEYEDILVLKEALNYSLGVNEVIERSFAESVAMLEIMFAGTSSQFGLLLADLEEPILKVTGRSANKFKVKIVKDEEPEPEPEPPADTTPPVVKISKPRNKYSTTRTDTTVTGTVDDAEVKSVDVNGTAAPVKDGAFSLKVKLKKGVNTITVSAEDEAGNEGTASVTATRTPFIKFKILDYEEKTFTGQIEEGATLKVNGKLTEVNDKGLFKIVLESAFEGELIFIVEDAKGNQTKRVHNL